MIGASVLKLKVFLKCRLTADDLASNPGPAPTRRWRNKVRSCKQAVADSRTLHSHHGAPAPTDVVVQWGRKLILHRRGAEGGRKRGVRLLRTASGCADLHAQFGVGARRWRRESVRDPVILRTRRPCRKRTSWGFGTWGSFRRDCLPAVRRWARGSGCSLGDAAQRRSTAGRGAPKGSLAKRRKWLRELRRHCHRRQAKGR